MRWWFQLRPKIRSIFRFWINCVFYPKPESRWKQQLQFASGISFIMFPIQWLWLWVYPIIKQTQLWPDGLSVRLLDAEHQILELRFERRTGRGKGGSMGSMVKGWIAARIRRNLLLYLDYFQVSFRPSLPSVDPIFYWWHSRSYRVLAQPKTNQILYPLWLIKMKFMGNCPKLRLEGAQILMILGSSLLRCSTEVHA